MVRNAQEMAITQPIRQQQTAPPSERAEKLCLKKGLF